MCLKRYVKISKKGGSRAVPIPRRFEFPGDEAIIRKNGDRLIIEPVRRQSLLGVLHTLSPLDEDFPLIANLPLDPVDL